VRIPLYLRGAAFDTYDGRSWSRDKTQLPARHTGNRIWTSNADTRLGSELMVIDLEPIQPQVVFLPTETSAFDLLTVDDHLTRRLPRVTHGREVDYQYQSLEERGLRYRVFGGVDAPPQALSSSDQIRYLALPANLSQRTRDLAKHWAEGTTTPREIAERIERKLRRNYRYDLDSPSGAAENPLEDFLFESRRGHCEYYSTSMAVMLRVLGVPSRNVTGFAGGTFNRFGRFYAVRQGDAHSWVEAYLPDGGWQRFDPTPASESTPRTETTGMVALVRDLLEAASERWDRHVVGYDLDQQVAFLRSVRQRLNRAGSPKSFVTGPGRWWVVVVLLGVSGWLLWRLRKRPAPKRIAPTTLVRPEALRVVQLYRELEREMTRWGVARPTHTPPLAHAAALHTARHLIADDVKTLTLVYQEVRFGDRAFGPEEEADFRARLAALRKNRAAAA
jgi:transglutaminase-like putative cysteine protease